jgi:uncharacterized small protein (DUF1192 family)
MGLVLFLLSIRISEPGRLALNGIVVLFRTFIACLSIPMLAVTIHAKIGGPGRLPDLFPLDIWRYSAGGRGDQGMDAEDLEPQKKKPVLRNLDPMSIEELQGYIMEMKEEISRVEAKIIAKKAHLSAAAGFFKTP